MESPGYLANRFRFWKWIVNGSPLQSCGYEFQCCHLNELFPTSIYEFQFHQPICILLMTCIFVNIKMIFRCIV